MKKNFLLLSLCLIYAVCATTAFAADPGEAGPYNADIFNGQSPVKNLSFVVSGWHNMAYDVSCNKANFLQIGDVCQNLTQVSFYPRIYGYNSTSYLRFQVYYGDYHKSGKGNISCSPQLVIMNHYLISGDWPNSWPYTTEGMLHSGGGKSTQLVCQNGKQYIATMTHFQNWYQNGGDLVSTFANINITPSN